LKFVNGSFRNSPMGERGWISVARVTVAIANRF
jgi:hypothetical protein